MRSWHFAFVFVFLVWEPLIKAIILSHGQRTGQGKQWGEIQIIISWGWGERNKIVSLPILWARLCISSLWWCQTSWSSPAAPVYYSWGKLTSAANPTNPSSDYMECLVLWNINSFLFIADCSRFLVRMKSSCSLDRMGVSPSWFPEGGGGEAGCEHG